jgi:hypothetical protein
MSIRTLALLAALLCAAPLTALSAQQTTSSIAVGSPSGPRLASPIQRVEPTWTAGNASPRSAYKSDGQHTITVSTLVLVLCVVILVLLIV